MKNYITKNGLDVMKKELDEYLVRRKEVLSHVVKAREMGDLSENGYYKAAKFELGQIDRRITYLRRVIPRLEVVSNTVAGIVGIGSSIVISDGKKEYSYIVVGQFEADPSLKKLSCVSPIGKALIGKRVGEVVKVDTPSGEKMYTILHSQ